MLLKTVLSSHQGLLIALLDTDQMLFRTKLTGGQMFLMLVLSAGPGAIINSTALNFR
jgi:hypothetical protein